MLGLSFSGPWGHGACRPKASEQFLKSAFLSWVKAQGSPGVVLDMPDHRVPTGLGGLRKKDEENYGSVKNLVGFQPKEEPLFCWGTCLKGVPQVQFRIPTDRNT